LNIPPETLDLLKVLAPILAAGATVARIIPSLVVATRSRQRPRNVPNRALRVATLNSLHPWDHVPRPANWDEEATRKKYRKDERRYLIISLSVFGLLSMAYLGVFIADLKEWRDGSGLLAGPSALLFAGIFITQAVYLRRISGQRGLGPSLYASRGEVAVAGDIKDVAQYSLSILFNIGCRLVSCETTTTADPAVSTVSIVASTGFFPPKWMDLGPLSLVSFRGERVTVSITGPHEGVCDVVVVSDNYDPGVDEGKRANQRNVRRFVESWAFSPEHLMIEPAP
jgi:hypothetical protein